MLFDYWFASFLGRAYLNFRESKRKAWGDSPCACNVIAHGGKLPARELVKTQIFAALIWYRFGVLSVFFMAVTGLAGVVIGLNRPQGAIVVLLAVFGGLAAFGIAQMGMINYRKNITHRHILRSGHDSSDRELQPGSRGLPRVSDFWLVLVVVAAVFSVVLVNAFHQLREW
jgi:amino acid transporter